MENSDRTITEPGSDELLPPEAKAEVERQREQAILDDSAEEWTTTTREPLDDPENDQEVTG